MPFLRYFLASSIGTVLALSSIAIPALAESTSFSAEDVGTENAAAVGAIAAEPPHANGQDSEVELTAQGDDRPAVQPSESVAEAIAADVEETAADDRVNPETEPVGNSGEAPMDAIAADVVDAAAEEAAEEVNEEIDEEINEPSGSSAPDSTLEDPDLDPLEPAPGTLESDRPRPRLVPDIPATVTTPEYLNPSANPLFYPTQFHEVEIIEVTPITLEQAIELARRHSVDLQEAYRNLEVAEAALRESQAANLPTLDAQANLTHQDTDDREPPSLFNPDPDTITTSLGAALELNYNIYTSGRRSSLIKAAEYRVRLQELQIEIVSEQLRLDVTDAYYDLQETDELVRIDRSALEQALQSLRDAQALERAGVGTRFSVLEAEVDVANARQELFQSLSDQQVARRAMVRLLNLSQVINVMAADEVEVDDLWELSLEDSILLAFQNRAELEQLLVQRDISEQLRQAELAALGPQVSAFARYDMQDLLDETNTASDRETYQVGIQASLRLYDGGAARAAARQEELNIQIAENNFTDTRNQIRFQVEQAYYELQANYASIQTASLAVETAAEALRLARLRFQAGVETQTDVLLAQTDLTRAEVNRLQAILGYNRSLASLRRAVSNYPDNDLSDRP